MQSASLKTSTLLAILICCCGRSTGNAQEKANLPPSKNFDLSSWNLSIPTDNDGDGKADTIDEAQLNKGYQNEKYFFTGSDGGMVFKVPIKGFKTSKNTKYTRTNYARCCVEAISQLQLGTSRDALIKTTGYFRRHLETLKSWQARLMGFWRPRSL